MTVLLFRDDAYLATAEATVTGVTDTGVTLDRTIFYATSGGQPGDTGRLMLADGAIVPVIGVVHPDGDKTVILHLVTADTALPTVGDTVTLELDWARRLKLMRMHTALHLLSVVFPFPVTGGSIGEDKGRLDFDMPEMPADLDALEARLNEMVTANHPVSTE